MHSRPVLLGLVLSTAILPVAVAIVWATSHLLAAMQDAAFAAVLDRVAVALAMLWAVGLVLLVLALALEALASPASPKDGR